MTLMEPGPRGSVRCRIVRWCAVAACALAGCFPVFTIEAWVNPTQLSSNNNTSLVNRYFQYGMTLDELRIFSRALTTHEICVDAGHTPCP